MNSFIYVFAFINANIAPHIKNFENRLFELNSMENIISRINETRICTNNKDKKHLIQDLNTCSVWCNDKVSIANGVNKIKILVIIYLIAYENAKLRKLIEITLFSNPSIVNMFKLFSSIYIIEFSFATKPEKHISVLNISSPIFLIANEIVEFK